VLITKLFRCCMLLLLLAMGSTANSAVLKIATLTPDGSVWMQKLRAGADEVERRTEGRIKIKFYPGGVMGDDNSVLRKIHIGQLQGAILTGGALQSVYPDSQVYNFPLLFKSYDEVDYVRQHLDTVLAKGFEAGGFVTYGFAEAGLAYPMTKGNPIRVPSDFASHKVWAPNDDPLSVVVFSTIQVTPIPLGLPDVLAGLQTNLIDTITSPPVPALVMQWHSQVKSVTDAPLSYIFGLMAIDKKVVASLPAADQAVLHDVMAATFHDIDQQNRADNINALAALEKQGITLIHLSDNERRTWSELGEKTHASLIEKGIASRDIYQRAETLLREFRQGKPAVKAK